MITFTETGAQKVQEFLASQSADVETAGLRVGVRGGGCSGLQYGLAFDNQGDDDARVADPGRRVPGGAARCRVRAPRRRRAGFQYAPAFDNQRDADEVFVDPGLRILVDRPSLAY